MQADERDGVRAEPHAKKKCCRNRVGETARCQRVEQRIEADAGEHRQRRNDEQEMPQAREGRPVRDHVAGDREDRRERHEGSLDAPAIAGVSGRMIRPRREGQREHDADQDRDSELDEKVRRHVPARHVGHRVEMPEQERTDLVVELREVVERAQRIERACTAHGQAADHDTVRDRERRREHERAANAEAADLLGATGRSKRRVGQHQQSGVANKDQADDAQAERGAEREPEAEHVPGAGRGRSRPMRIRK